MAKLSKAFALLMLLAAWFLPAQLASAASSVQTSNELSASVRHQEDGEDELEEEDEEDEEENEDEEEDEDGKQFAPPPLVVKHKSMSGQGDSREARGSSNSKGSKLDGVIKGAVPSSSETLLKVAGLGIVSLEQVFATPEYVTSAVNEPDETATNQTSGSTSAKPVPTGDAVNPNLSEPVVNSIGLANYEDPAGEFMNKAYFGIAVLGAAAIAMTGHTISKARKSADSVDTDYEYDAEN